MIPKWVFEHDDGFGYGDGSGYGSSYGGDYGYGSYGDCIGFGYEEDIV
jgi:hypothetical protein